MTALLVVPLDRATALGHGARGRAWRYVERSLRDSPYHPTIGALAGEWCKAEAVRLGIEHAAQFGLDPDVLIVHDADVLVDLDELRRCVDHVREHGGWAVPHRLVYRLTRAATDELLTTGTARGACFERYPYEGFPGGGVTVVHADVYRDCPLDPRFIGWGGEDIAWGRALTLLHAAPFRSNTPLWHLWHEHPSPTTQQRPARVESQVLLRAYRTKRLDRMRALVDRARAVVD